MAGYQIGLRVEGLAFMPGIGFTVAAMTLMGQSLGKNDPQSAHDDVLKTMKIAAWFMGIMGIFMIVPLFADRRTLPSPPCRLFCPFR